MRKLLAAVALTALTLAACGEQSVRISTRSERTSDRGVLRVVSELECPEHQGALTRVRTAPDGLSCDYAGPRGSEVTLRLIRLQDDVEPELALDRIDRELNALMPGVAVKIAEGEIAARIASEAQQKAKVAQAKADEAQALADQAQAAADAAQDAAFVDDSEPEAGRHPSHRTSPTPPTPPTLPAQPRDKADVSLPGLRVKTDEDRTAVRLPGLKVDASDEGARVSILGITIDARSDTPRVKLHTGDEKVEISAHSDAAEIRAHGTGSGVRTTYVLVDETGDQPWKLVGYEARGPASGPLVAAVVRSKSRHQDEVFRAAKALVTRNVGK